MGKFLPPCLRLAARKTISTAQSFAVHATTLGTFIWSPVELLALIFYSSRTKNHTNDRTTSLGVFLGTPDESLGFSPSPLAWIPFLILYDHATSLGAHRTSDNLLEVTHCHRSLVTSTNLTCPAQDHAPPKRSAISRRPRHNDHPSVLY